jgi:hypothetical protein
MAKTISVSLKTTLSMPVAVGTTLHRAWRDHYSGANQTNSTLYSSHSERFDVLGVQSLTVLLR